MKIHIVQKGDTLWKIAKKYGVNFEELKKMNSQLSNPDMIMPGMKIKVPTSGGNIKKEAPTGTPSSSGAKINLGAKKEMPKQEHPFAKEKPMAPIEEISVEIPKEMPVKEKPIKEKVKEKPVEEKPVVPEVPVQQPKMPYIPKMPKPIIPEIDINNYFTMNMANVNVHEQAQVPPPVTPQLPPKPINVLPEVKPVSPVQETPVIEEESPIKEMPVMEKPVYQNVGGQYQPMYPYMPVHNPCQDPCYPGHPSPSMPYPAQMPYPQVQGAYMPEQQMPYPQVQGAHMPEHQMPYPQVQGAYMPEHQMPYPQVQGAYMPCPPMPCPPPCPPPVQGAYMPEHQMPYPQVQGAYMPEQQMPYPQVQGAYMPEHQMPYPQVQGAYMPEQPMQMMPGVAESPGMFEESSPFMPPMPVMGGEAMDYGQQYAPQVQGAYMAEQQQMPYPQVQGAYMPEQQMPYPQVQGAYMPEQQMPYPQVQGAYMPEQPMPMHHQMPAMLPMQGHQSFPLHEKDCGCGGPKPPHHLGGYGVQPSYHSPQMMHGQHMPFGYGGGFNPTQYPAQMGYGQPPFAPNMYGRYPSGDLYRSPYGFSPDPEYPPTMREEESSEFNG